MPNRQNGREGRPSEPKNNEQTSDQATWKTTSAFRADLLGELDAAAAAAAEARVWGVEELPSGSAVVVVKRGPNAGSRFRLDQRSPPPAVGEEQRAPVTAARPVIGGERGLHGGGGGVDAP